MQAVADDDIYSSARAPKPDSEIGFYPEGISVDVRALDEKNWKLLQTFEYRGARRTFVIEAGVTTDFASVPRPFVWLIPPYGLYTRAAVLHDVLCDQGVERDVSRRDADGIFRQALRILGVPFLQRWLMWVGVRLGALQKQRDREGWLKDAWLVVPIVLAIAPLLVPPALVILAVLVIWKVLEQIVWLALGAARRGKAAGGSREAPAKRLNEPTITLTT